MSSCADVSACTFSYRTGDQHVSFYIMAKSGRARSIVGYVPFNDGSGIHEDAVAGCQWNNTSDEITSIKFFWETTATSVKIKVWQI